jgi:hypothetical protein
MMPDQMGQVLFLSGEAESFHIFFIKGMKAGNGQDRTFLAGIGRLRFPLPFLGRFRWNT